MKTTKRTTQILEQTLTIGFSELVALLQDHGIDVSKTSKVTVSAYAPHRDNAPSKQSAPFPLAEGGDIALVVQTPEQLHYDSSGTTPEEEERLRNYSP